MKQKVNLFYFAAKIRFIFYTAKLFHKKVKEISSQPFAGILTCFSLMNFSEELA